MDPLYKRTFDQVRMSEEKAREMRAALASRCSRDELEVTDMTNKNRRPLTALAAVCMIVALSATAFAYGGRIVERVFHMMSGVTIEQGVNEDGSYYFEDSGPEGVVSPVELRSDGRLYLTANGEDLDITGQCSNDTPYLYDCVDQAGARHVFLIGGVPEAIGWVECMFDSADNATVSGMVMGLPDGADADDLPWLDAGLAQLDVVLGGMELS